MKSANPMLSAQRELRSAILALFYSLPLLLLASCTLGPKAQPGPILVQPYSNTQTVIWAVAPARNESGTSLVDELAVADLFVNQIQQVQGLTAIPVNRTLGVMRAMNVPAIESEAEALAVARTLGADAILVPVVTAWDPYDPLQLGMVVALFARGDLMRAGIRMNIQPETLQMARTDTELAIDWRGPGPVAMIGEHFDAADYNTREMVRLYASTKPGTPAPIGLRLHVSSMGLYSKFVSFELTRRLLAMEANRIGQPGAETQVTQAR